ncbi:efflux RND transporter periplasmic adaptor subunit [Flavihumibacter sp. UBA7668]|uniref:efflux RND transporter periplasmic adaptor subunit n=1 Tax=Flavihumibacter sp. UBA7668 TaxID=1946542 RepID=UPI0025C71C8B|nr:efflux RND transporter periplasmic adaptor subunit [Flavihumibacter sp. UBA7668]
MQTNKWNHFIAAIVVVALSAACSSKASDSRKVEDKTTIPPALPVDVIIASEITLDQTEIVAGSIVPNRTVDIMSELSRKVSYVAFKDGSYVSQGQLLYKLDDSDIRAKLRQLQADLNLAQIIERRLYELLKTETVRQEEYDIALAKVQSLQAAEEILRVELAKTSVRAPFSGVIGISKVFAGSLVSPGLPLVNLQESGTLKIQFNVSEKYLPLINSGNKISFTTEQNKEQDLATVVSTEAGVDLQSRNITVQAIINKPLGKLKAGMSAKVFFKTTKDNEKGIFVPTEALLPGASGYSVFLVKNGVAKITEVAVVNRNEKAARISTGIASGDTVMISNMLRAGDGMPVSVVSIK